MTDSNFTFIQPVENLHSIHSVTPAQQREEQKRKQKPPEQQQQPRDKPQNEKPQESTPDRNDGPHRIDYRA